MNKKDNLVWIDLEMTGLTPEKHVILEIASLVTTKDLDVVAEGPTLVIHHPTDALATIDEWPKSQHTQSGLLDAVKQSQTSLADAEAQTLAFMQQYCEQGESPLCGNSVWQD